MKKIFLLLSLTLLKGHLAFSFTEMNEKKIPSFKDLNPISFEDTATVSYRKILDSDLQEAYAVSNELKDPQEALTETLQKQNKEYISSLGFSNYP